MRRRTRSPWQRLSALETQFALPLLFDPVWRALAARNPEACRRVEALTRRERELWPGRSPTTDECLADPLCFEHFLWLESTRLGGLGALLAHGFPTAP